jgi:hypothetical protein
MQTEKGNRVIGRQYCRPSFASQRSVGVSGIEGIFATPLGAVLPLNCSFLCSPPQHTLNNRILIDKHECETPCTLAFYA